MKGKRDRDHPRRPRAVVSWKIEGVGTGLGTWVCFWSAVVSRCDLFIVILEYTLKIWDLAFSYWICQAICKSLTSFCSLTISLRNGSDKTIWRNTKYNRSFSENAKHGEYSSGAERLIAVQLVVCSIHTVPFFCISGYWVSGELSFGRDFECFFCPCWRGCGFGGWGLG